MPTYHEFGHFVMYSLFTSRWPFNYTGPTHDWCTILAVEPAWTEGYATSFAVLAFGSGYYVYQDGRVIPIELYCCSKQQNAATDEFRIAAALWDLADYPNDGPSSDKAFGRADVADKNQDNTLTHKEILIDPLAVFLSTYLDYVKVLEQRFSGVKYTQMVEVLRYNWLV